MGAGVMNKGGGGGSRRRRRRTSGGSKAMAEINITPFVDVMLVLLIIFMVAAPLMTVGVPVELPKTQASALPTDEEEPLTVTITAEGVLLIQNTETEEGELVAKLQAIAAERSSDRIYLRADGSNAWNNVAEVMGLLNAGGFSNIGLVTDVASPAGTDG
ncbi:ExbD/TolR family protein [Marivivens donghaensis]|uniref:ExbD/TolR family protein n=1 Tax=Marivivens donghaensis TaxID=1699413 RepID=A0ABX0VWL2_9RHOB|nr:MULTISPECIES: ExbD/TolR family protein [Marivivens]NIY72199.1 ExbD/TolR family protein [Marivivens donghaensis]